MALTMCAHDAQVRLRGGHEHSDEAEVQLEVPRPAHAMLRETGSGVRGDSGAPAAGASRLTPEVEDSEENVALEVEEESVQDGRAEEMVRGGSVADACVQEEEFAEEKEELERTRIEVEELKARILKNPKSRKRKNKTKHAQDAATSISTNTSASSTTRPATDTVDTGTVHGKTKRKYIDESDEQEA